MRNEILKSDENGLNETEKFITMIGEISQNN